MLLSPTYPHPSTRVGGPLLDTKAVLGSDGGWRTQLQPNRMCGSGRGGERRECVRRRGIHNSNLIGNIACVKVCGSGRVLRRCVRRRCVMGEGVRVGRGGRVRNM